jgi:phosphate:Na+ symporter
MDSALPAAASNSLNVTLMAGQLIGGLALFLFGLELMTAGLKAIAGSRLQSVLGKLTANRFRGVWRALSSPPF